MSAAAELKSVKQVKEEETDQNNETELHKVKNIQNSKVNVPSEQVV